MKSLDHYPSWKISRSSASQRNTRIFLNPKVHYHIHKNPPTVHNLCRVNPVHNFQTPFFEARLILSHHPLLKNPPILSFPQISPLKFRTLLVSHLFVPHAYPSSSSLIQSPYRYLMRGTNCKDTRYLWLFSPLSAVKSQILILVTTTAFLISAHWRFC